MSEESQEQPIYERLPDEPNNWYGRFVIFRDLGPARKLLPAVHAFEIAENSRKKQNKPLSKKVPGSWNAAAEQWNWKKRAEAYDKAERERIEAQKQAHIDSILQEEFALKHERVKALNEIAHKLIGYLNDEDNIWLPDVKSIGAGLTAQRVDLIRFNAELFAEIRAHLDDIAKEMGERVKKQEVNNKGNPLAAVNVHVFLPD